MSKFTPWFFRDTQPVRSGWYQVKGEFCMNDTGEYSNEKITFRYFDAAHKKWYWRSPKHGFTLAGFGCDDQWRGLTKEQK